MLDPDDHARRRSARAEVRNPILSLPAFKALRALDPPVRVLLVALLRDLQRDARARAQHSWDRHKPPVAAYWAATGVCAGHAAKALRPERRRRGNALRMIVRQPGYADLIACDWADASQLYCRRRDKSGLGASGFPEATVLLDDIPVGRISYNGRIWPLAPWTPEVEPIYDNRQPCL